MRLAEISGGTSAQRHPLRSPRHLLVPHRQRQRVQGPGGPLRRHLSERAGRHRGELTVLLSGLPGHARQADERILQTACWIPWMACPNGVICMSDAILASLRPPPTLGVNPRPSEG